MRHDKQVSIIRELFHQLDRKATADAVGQLLCPTEIYSCPDIASSEWRTLFGGQPQLVGLSSDLPEPGSFLTMDDFGVPLLVTRDDDGRMRAFVNACRHRGAPLAEDRRGLKRRFTCPFHAWTYSNSGGLLRPDLSSCSPGGVSLDDRGGGLRHGRGHAASRRERATRVPAVRSQ